jgi:hypothetical protein
MAKIEMIKLWFMIKYGEITLYFLRRKHERLCAENEKLTKLLKEKDAWLKQD